MGLLAELGLPEGQTISITDAEKDVASGGLPPEGVHHAMLDSVGDLVIDGAKRGWKLGFIITAGPGKDAKVEETLWLPKGDDANKDKRTRNRITLFAHRLGLLKKVVKNGVELAVEAEGKTDFCDCLGATAFVDVRHEEEEYEKDGRKRKITKAKLTFEGLLSPDDKKVKGVPTGKGGAVSGGAGGGGGGGATAGAKKDQFEGL